MQTEWLVKADKNLFFLLNKKFPWQSLENVMLLLRQPLTWIPLYFFLLLFFYANCRKYIVPIILLSIFTFAITDYTSASIIKPLVGRLRPCHDATINFMVNNPAGCGGLYSMPSSHASNHFGIACFWFLVVRHTVKRSWYWLWLVAAAIGYAQIYVGVHFPGDILAGALLGIVTGYAAFFFYKKWVVVINNPAIIDITA